MTIAARCTSCSQGHKAPDHLAGKTLKCRKCGEPLTVPAVPPPEPEPEFDAAEYLLQSDAVAPPPPVAAARPSREAGAARAIKPRVTSLPPLTTNDPPLWRRYLHWALVLALLPLAASLLTAGKDGESLSDRIDKTLERATPAEQKRFVEGLERSATLDDLLDGLPKKKLDGALLTRSSPAHWLMALAATALYMLFLVYLASDGSAKAAHVLSVGLITATVGVGLLLLVQWLASLTDGRIVVGRGVLGLVFIVLKFVAFSYSAATDPDNGFLLSFVGYTLGVGLLEELTKTVPLFWHRDESVGGGRGGAARRANWRGLFIWGLASGAGFGIAEGIIYSARYYNGISGPGIYAVRFLSCVALHAIWSGSVAITLYLKRDLFDSVGE